MASFNKVILLGNLTRDPELRYTPKGQAIAKLGLAVNRSYKLDSGETKEEVTFIDVDSFGKTAELIGQYLRKGSPIFIEGRLRLDQWDDKNTGQKVSKLKVVLESFQFVGGNRAEGGGPGSGGPGVAPSAPPPRPTRQASPAAAPSDGEAPAGEVDDVPF